MADKRNQRARGAWSALWLCAGIAGSIFFLWLIVANAIEVWWLHDTHHNTDVIKSTTDWIHMNTEFTENSTCSDGNECTLDGYTNGICQNYNLPNGENCTSECFSGTPTCQSGECSGTCLGTCEVDEDCPTVTDFNDVNMTANCFNTVCTYNTTATDTEIQIYPCTGDSFDAATCLAVVSNATYRDCLTAHPFCTSQGPPSDLTCVYTFSCASPAILLT